MASSKLNINTVGVTYQLGGTGTPSPLTKITKSSIDGGVTNVTFKGDGDQFNTFEATVNQVPTVTLESGYVGAVMASVAGSIGTLALTWPDARNGTAAGGGGISWTLTNAIVSDKNAQAPHAQIASGSIVFSSFSPDGTTNPLSFTYL